MNNTFNAKTFDNFLSISECESLINYASSTEMWKESETKTHPYDFWSGRTINYKKIIDPEYKNIFKSLMINIQKTIISEYNISEIYPDTIDLVRWFEGMEQVPHCDDMSNNNEEVKKFGHRVFGCVLYLNDDYEGGKTYYPNFDIEITPKMGKLAVHPGDCVHLHGVTPIKNSTRYTVASFWTLDKNRSIL